MKRYIRANDSLDSFENSAESIIQNSMSSKLPFLNSFEIRNKKWLRRNTWDLDFISNSGETYTIKQPLELCFAYDYFYQNTRVAGIIATFLFDDTEFLTTRWIRLDVEGSYIPDGVAFFHLYGGNYEPVKADVSLNEAIKSIKWPKNTAFRRFVAQFDKSVKISSVPEIVSFLKSNQIDTTKHKYELVAESYSNGKRYTYKFTAYGDWMAYLSMALHRNMKMSSIDKHVEDLFGDIEDIPSNLLSVESMFDYASDYWWGDGDDYIISLRNLDTGEILYESGESEEYEEEDNW